MIEKSKKYQPYSYQGNGYWQGEMVLSGALAFVYNQFNSVIRGILGLASAAGEHWFIVFIKKPWQLSLSGLFYWRYNRIS